MDIGTAKPNLKELTQAPHHLIDVIDPDEPFSLESWLDRAKAVLENVWDRGKQPILAGGTGQYVWALLEGWQVPRVPPQPQLRRELESRPALELYQELRRVDPEAAARMDPRNVRRTVRALEVYRVTGKPFSHWYKKSPPPFSSLVLGLRWPREELLARIDERVDRMIAGGLVEEVRRLLTMGYSATLPAMSATGYRQVCQYLAGEISLDEASARTKKETHQLVRHQNAWFRREDSRIHWIEAPEEKRLEEGLDLAREWLGNSDSLASNPPS